MRWWPMRRTSLKAMPAVVDWVACALRSINLQQTEVVKCPNGGTEKPIWPAVGYHAGVLSHSFPNLVTCDCAAWLRLSTTSSRVKVAKRRTFSLVSRVNLQTGRYLNAPEGLARRKCRRTEKEDS